MEITLKTLHDDVRNLEKRLLHIETNTTRWMVGLFIGGVVLFATIVGVYTSAVIIAIGG